jgi:hypothetical protein
MHEEIPAPVSFAAVAEAELQFQCQLALLADRAGTHKLPRATAIQYM